MIDNMRHIKSPTISKRALFQLRFHDMMHSLGAAAAIPPRFGCYVTRTDISAELAAHVLKRWENWDVRDPDGLAREKRHFRLED